MAARIAAVGAQEALQSLGPDTAMGARMAARLPGLDVDRDFEIAQRLGARIVVPGDDEWPQGFGDLAAPPLCLWLHGPADLAEVAVRSVSIVGARAATGYGVHLAKDLAAGLAERDFAVVSGAAYGIDGAAHEGALAVGRSDHRLRRGWDRTALPQRPCRALGADPRDRARGQ